jgi:hypothetical protein
MPKYQTDTSRNHDLKKIVLSAAKTDWLKVAMIIGRANRECEARHIAVSYEEIATCIQSLCESGRLESVGDITNWRHSEVRLATSA